MTESTPDSLCIELRGLCFAARSSTGSRRDVLSDVAVEFHAGEVSLIRGGTGVGKTTLLHVIAGLLRPTSGEVVAAGQAVSRYVGSHRERWRRSVGLVFQQPQLIADLTVAENVMLPLVPRSLAASEVRARALGALAELGLRPLAGQLAGELSSGQQQRVGLARAVAAEPSIVLADEPTAHQDAEGVELVMATMLAAKQRGAVVLIACHDPRVVDGGLADRTWELADGRLEARRLSSSDAS